MKRRDLLKLTPVVAVAACLPALVKSEEPIRATSFPDGSTVFETESTFEVNDNWNHEAHRQHVKDTWPWDELQDEINRVKP